jgi:hypothetical protein
MIAGGEGVIAWSGVKATCKNYPWGIVLTVAAVNHSHRIST